MSDEIKVISCEEWLDKHPDTKWYLNYLIEKGGLPPARADYLVKKIIIDESGIVYEDTGIEDYGFEQYCDLANIPGYFYKKKD